MRFLIKPVTAAAVLLALCLPLAPVATSTTDAHSVTIPGFSGIPACDWALDLPHTWLQSVDTLLKGAGINHDWTAANREYMAFFVSATGTTSPTGNSNEFKGKKLLITWKTPGVTTYGFKVATGSPTYDQMQIYNTTGSTISNGYIISYDNTNNPVARGAWSWPASPNGNHYTSFAAAGDCLSIIANVDTSAVTGTQPHANVTEFPKFTVFNWNGVFDGTSYTPPTEIPSGGGTVNVDGGISPEEVHQIIDEYAVKGAGLLIAFVLAFICIWALRWHPR